MGYVEEGLLGKMAGGRGGRSSLRSQVHSESEDKSIFSLKYATGSYIYKTKCCHLTDEVASPNSCGWGEDGDVKPNGHNRQQVDLLQVMVA